LPYGFHLETIGDPEGLQTDLKPNDFKTIEGFSVGKNSSASDLIRQVLGFPGFHSSQIASETRKPLPSQLPGKITLLFS
jgi:hypothetical protein